MTTKFNWERVKRKKLAQKNYKPIPTKKHKYWLCYECKEKIYWRPFLKQWITFNASNGNKHLCFKGGRVLVPYFLRK